MSDTDEREELRALQARAYGRDGGLSGTEAARLRELADRRPERATEESPAPVADPVEAPDRERSRLLLVAALAAVLLVGIGIGAGAGWMLFGRESAPSIALTPDQQQMQDDLSAGAGFDPGSLRAVSVQDDVVAWHATMQRGEKTCLMIGNGQSGGVSCEATTLVQQGGLLLTLAQVGEQASGQITGQMFLSLGGEPAVALRLFRYNTDSEGLATTYANGDEERFADSLVDEGFSESSLQVLGYDGDNPIWTGFLPGEGLQCLIYSVLPSQSWAQCSEALDKGLSVERVDAQTDLKTSVVWNGTTGTGSHLQITTSEDVGDVAGE